MKQKKVFRKLTENARSQIRKPRPGPDLELILSTHYIHAETPSVCFSTRFAVFAKLLLILQRCLLKKIMKTSGDSISDAKLII